MPVQKEFESSKHFNLPSRNTFRSKDCSDRTFLELLRSKEASLDHLMLLKNFAKSNLNHPESELPRPIFSVIYYASIAAALCLHGKRITSLSDTELKNAFNWGLHLSWIGREIESILRDGLNWLEGQNKT